MADARNAITSKLGPQTPPHRIYHEFPQYAGASTGNNSHKEATSTPKTTVEDFLSSPRAFLAYTRRVRSFSSSLQLQKSHYLLNFDDEGTAQEWWSLMQTEYPDSIRESPQLFSFKSDRVPARAKENPKFVHLKDKWTFRPLTEAEKARFSRGEEKQSSAEKRASVARSPSLPVLREGSPSPELVRDAEVLEDPFTPNGGPIQQNVDLAQLSITTERIHNTVSQYSANLDMLVEGHQVSAQGMRGMQVGVESMTVDVKDIAQRQKAHEVSMRHMQDGIHQGLTQTSSLIEMQADLPSVASIHDLQVEVAETSAQVKRLLDSQRTARKTMLKMKDGLSEQAATQKTLVGQMQVLQEANMRNQGLIKDLAEGYNTRFEKMMSAFEQHTTQTRELLQAQQRAAKLSQQEVLVAIKANNAPICTHDVLPPPRKMNRKLVGYVYSRIES